MDQSLDPSGIQALLADQTIVASIALVIFAGVVVLLFIFNEERKSRRPRIDVHSGPDDVETRSRRAF